MEKSMFEKAARAKLRFSTPRGKIMVEDLWDLPLAGEVSLDTIARSTYKEIKANEDESFIDGVSPKNESLELKMGIVKHVIKVRLEERDDSVKSLAKAQKRQKILGMIERKKDESLESMSLEDLQALLSDD